MAEATGKVPHKALSDAALKAYKDYIERHREAAKARLDAATQTLCDAVRRELRRSPRGRAALALLPNGEGSVQSLGYAKSKALVLDEGNNRIIVPCTDGAWERLSLLTEAVSEARREYYYLSQVGTDRRKYISELLASDDKAYPEIERVVCEALDRAGDLMHKRIQRMEKGQ